jgi:hypothetical protein
VALVVIAKDGFPVVVAAQWAVHSEAHEPMTPACHQEAAKSRLYRLERLARLQADSGVSAASRVKRLLTSP